MLSVLHSLIQISLTVAYATNPSAKITSKIKSSIRNYFSTVYDFLDILNRLSVNTSLLNEFEDEKWEDIISEIEDHLNLITDEIEKETNELLKSRK